MKPRLHNKRFMHGTLKFRQADLIKTATSAAVKAKTRGKLWPDDAKKCLVGCLQNVSSNVKCLSDIPGEYTATTHGNITNLLTGISSRCHNSYIYLKLSIVIDVCTKYLIFVLIRIRVLTVNV